MGRGVIFRVKSFAVWLLIIASAVSIHAWIPWPFSATVKARIDSTTLFFSRYKTPLYHGGNEESYGPPAPAVDSRYYTYVEAPVQSSRSRDTKQPNTLSRFLSDAVKENAELRDLESLFMGIQMACKTIASLVNRAGLVYSITEDIRDDITDGRFYSMKRLDHLSTVVLKNALKYTGKCEVLAPKSRLDNESPAQHQPGVLIAKSMDSNYVACLDPLDGSGNADASICTGTVFGVFEKETSTGISLWKKSREDRDRELVDSVLQPGKNMRAAGYCLYSSATVLVFTLGESVQGFTLDPQMQEFVLTHPDLTIPKRGSVYSCNEANSEGWDDAYNSYLRNLKTGKGETGKRYAHRYVGSMVGDIHRTLLYGGIFAYPADRLEHPDGNLQLLYKAAPMAYIVHTAGGKAIDGRSGSLLEVRPDRVHQKSPCFIGSYDDVSEWESYLSDNEGIYYKKGRD